MEYQTLLLERKNNTGIVRLNRPKQRNALSSQLVIELFDALSRLEADSETRVIILTSAVPGMFCAGKDLTELARAQAGDIMQQRGAFAKSAELLQMLPNIKKFVIAAVSGPAVGGGCGIAAACDFIVAADNATFSMPEIFLGLFPMIAAPSVVNSIGLKKSLELFALGVSIDAREAERLGLVNRVVPAEKLEESALKMAQELAAKSQVALQLGKRAFYNMLNMDYTKAVDYGLGLLAILVGSKDGKEGVAAFLEKRPPKW